ncbi:hypothetical protein O77CONTIG1_02640 [Leptolyngbya sp. O-77]|nr:hypothetical protein O77CONTIG1_02640 [Leptolyngbya sp. O-77]
MLFDYNLVSLTTTGCLSASSEGWSIVIQIVL